MVSAAWDADLYQRGHSFVWEYGADLVEMLAPRAGETILDLGCGTGQLALKIAGAGARAGGVRVVGIDSSVTMIEQARRNLESAAAEAEKLADAVRFAVADGTSFSPAELGAEPFDAVFSNAALHWMRPPEMAAGCLARALRPGGRVVAEMGGRGNVTGIVAALNAAVAEVTGLPRRDFNPWYFPSVGEHASLLESVGLEVVSAALFDRPTTLVLGEQGIRAWIEMFGAAFLVGLDGAQRDEVMVLAEAALAPAMLRDSAPELPHGDPALPRGSTWVADYRRLRFVAIRR